MSNITPHDIESAVRSLTVAQPTNLGMEISLPVMFPGGDFVTIVVTAEGGEHLVHDSSGAVMFLASVGVRLTSDAKKRLPAVIARYGCEMAGERVVRHCTREQLAVAVATVANASRAIADYALEARRRVESEFREAVTSRIRAVAGQRLRVNEEIRGASGRPYRVHNVILDAAMRVPVAYVEPVATRSVVAAHFAEFYDLRNPDAANVCVYDDNSDLRVEDVNFLSGVGEVVAFSESQARLRRYA